MEIKECTTLTSFPVWYNGTHKKYYSLKRQGNNRHFKLVYYSSCGSYGSTEHIVASFEGHMVEEPDLYWFVDVNPLASMQLSTEERVAIDRALAILNSKEDASKISGGVIR